MPSLHPFPITHQTDNMEINKTCFSENPHWNSALNERAKLLFGANWEYDFSLIKSKRTRSIRYLRIGIDSKTLSWDWPSSHSSLNLWSGYDKYDRSDPVGSVPSVLRIAKDGIIRMRVNYLNDLRHDSSPDVPAYQLFDENGTMSKTVHFKKNQAQNPNDHTPAEVSYYDTGVPMEVRWVQNGLGEDNKFGVPSRITYTRDGAISGGYSSIHGTIGKKLTEVMLDMVKRRLLSGLVGENQIMALSAKSPHPLPPDKAKVVYK